MIDHGVYRLRYRGLRLREGWRLGGPAAFPVAVALKLLGVKGAYLWLPPGDTERPCAKEALSAEAQARLAAAADDLAGLGYREGLYGRLIISLDPAFKDGGSYRALHEDGKRMIFAGYLRQETPQGARVVRRDVLNISGLILGEGGQAVAVVNNRNYLDDDGAAKVVEAIAADPAFVVARLKGELDAAPWPVRRFTGIEPAAAAMAERDALAWEARIRRGLVVKVSGEEERRVVADARARLAAPPE
jgi:hypothetical protein